MRKSHLITLWLLICVIITVPCYASAAKLFEKDVKEALINRNWDKAAETANIWKEQEKTAPVPHLVLAYIYYAEGNYQKVPQLLNSIADQDKKECLLTWAQDFAREYPQNPLPYLLKGDAFLRLKNYSEAISQFDTAEKLGPCIFLTYIAKGISYALDNKFDLAIENFTQAIKLNPGLADALNSRGIVYYCEGNYERALSDFDQAIKLNPGFTPAYLGRSKVYHYLGKDILASEDLKKAKELSREGFAISNTSIKDPSTGKIAHKFSAGLDIKPEIKNPEGKLYSFGRLQGVDSKPEGQIIKIKEGEIANEKILDDNFISSALSFLLYNGQFCLEAAKKE